jgi:hypothetical protein
MEVSRARTTVCFMAQKFNNQKLGDLLNINEGNESKLIHSEFIQRIAKGISYRKVRRRHLANVRKA